MREREEVPYLTELGSEGVVDHVEGTLKSGELLASLVGDGKLSHRIPIYALRCLKCRLTYVLPCSTHVSLP
nr:hypothetical protein CFP56_48506 [Quercus suber]